MKIKSAQLDAELVTGPGEAFAPLAEQFGSVWLDSSMQSGGMGTQSLVASQPVMDISQNSGRVSISGRKPVADTSGTGTIMEIVQKLCQQDGLVAIGYMTFEATLPWLGLDHGEESLPIPEARFLLYESIRRFDHDSSDRYAMARHESIEASDGPPGLPPVTIRSSLSKDDYLDSVRTIKEHIKEGDIYQANFTTRFEVSGSAVPFEVYRRLRRYNPAPYAAYLNFGDYQILSSSPERMFLRQNDHITTSPIKGTIRRGDNDREDGLNLKTLLQSEKDRAELLMIVDLERNDLGKLARPGSVRVDDLFKPLQYSSVFHLAANVSATLKPDVSLSEVVEALLPGGSISGAPKKRAVQIIRQLETVPRSIYTGCIGYIDRQTADFNIAIRTMLHHNGRYYVHAGGGIVADSDPEEEYREMLLKARNLFRALGADPAKIVQ